MLPFLPVIICDHAVIGPALWLPKTLPSLVCTPVTLRENKLKISLCGLCVTSFTLLFIAKTAKKITL